MRAEQAVVDVGRRDGRQRARGGRGQRGRVGQAQRRLVRPAKEAAGDGHAQVRRRRPWSGAVLSVAFAEILETLGESFLPFMFGISPFSLSIVSLFQKADFVSTGKKSVLARNNTFTINFYCFL